ncbi:MAG: hypothetical protein JWM53_838 [bacterium]|nr:hypothetical protein [bacterium]
MKENFHRETGDQEIRISVFLDGSEMLCRPITDLDL